MNNNGIELTNFNSRGVMDDNMIKNKTNELNFEKIKSLNRTFTIIIIILSIILVIGIVLAIIFYIEYDNTVKDESPLCLTGSCAATSKACGLIPFTEQNGEFICKTDLFTSRAPNVTTTSN